MAGATEGSVGLRDHIANSFLDFSTDEAADRFVTSGEVMMGEVCSDDGSKGTLGDWEIGSDTGSGADSEAGSDTGSRAGSRAGSGAGTGVSSGTGSDTGGTS